jgi:hypothetical protein
VKSPEHLAQLRDHVLELGEPTQVANGIVGWLLGKATGRPDITSSDTRAKYRSVLRKLAGNGTLMAALLATPIIFDPDVMSSQAEERPLDPVLAGAGVAA